jgi:hypothetical protein
MAARIIHNSDIEVEPGKYFLIAPKFRLIDYTLKIEFGGIQRFREIIANLEDYFFPFFKRFFKLVAGVDYHFSRRTEDKFSKVEQFQITATHLKNARRIQIALGEMGHQLMERKDILRSIKIALGRNRARVEIIHGPRIDPVTHSIYELGKGKNAKAMEFYQLLTYKTHHYILIEDKKGRTIAFEEGTHNETLWGKNRKEEIVSLGSSRSRSYYFIPNTNKRILFLRAEFERRKSRAVSIEGRPLVFIPQAYSPIKIWFDFIYNLLHKLVFQPLAIVSRLPLDYPMQFVNRFPVPNLDGVVSLSKRRTRTDTNKVIGVIFDSKISYEIFSYLGERTETTVSSLAEALNIPLKTVANYLSHYRENGLVNRRKERIYLSGYGEKINNKIRGLA